LASLPLPEVAALLTEEDRHTARLQRAAERSSPRDYVSALLARARSPLASPPPSAPPMATAPRRHLVRESGPRYTVQQQWTRWELAPGVELHVRADASERQPWLVQRLLDAANEASAGTGPISEEETP
jgi:hypothetical protein